MARIEQGSSIVPWRNVRQARLDSKNGLPAKRHLGEDLAATDLMGKLIRRNSGLARPRRGDPKVTKTHFENKLHTGVFAAAVAVPLWAAERPEEVIPTFESIVAAAGDPTDTPPTYLMVDINYQADGRRRQEELREYAQKAATLQEAVADTVVGPDKNVSLVVVNGQLPVGTEFSLMKNMILFTAAADLSHHALGTNNYRCTAPDPDTQPERLYRLPFFSYDGDSVIPEDALVEGARVLNEYDALFVNGIHHYTGGIMDLSPEQIMQSGDITTNEKLVYFTEMMRRKMFDDLSPDAYRGYFLDDGAGTWFGNIITLGAFNPYSAQNESYFLLDAANKALDKHENRPLVYHNSAAVPYIHKEPADWIDAFGYHAPYIINTSARGLFENVRYRGRWALVDYDQGEEYGMYWDFAKTAKQPFVEPEPSQEELIVLVDGIYAHFAKDGGKLVGPDVWETKELFKKLFPEYEGLNDRFPLKVEMTPAA